MPNAAEQLRVMLIDDQPMIGEAVRRALGDQPNLVFSYCADPTQGIPQVLTFQPTVILQDLVMPEVDGLQLLRFFRANATTRDIPMIMLSSKEEAELKAQAFRLGANDYVVKLPEPVELLARIRYHSASYVNAKERWRYLQALEIEKARSEQLLHNVLPNDIVTQLKRGEKVYPVQLDSTSVLFADIVGFTELTSRLSPINLVATLQQIFDTFDDLTHKHHVDKIKTIGDAYMAVSGAPTPCEDHALRMARLAIDMKTSLAKLQDRIPHPVNLRIGIASGTLVAGIIGTTRFIYDLWGDTVNIASRMESHGLPGEIQVTEATYELIKDEFICDLRGLITIKGKGEMQTYWLRSER